MKRHLLSVLVALTFCAGLRAQTSTSATVSYVLGLGDNVTCVTATNPVTHKTTTTETQNDGFISLQYQPNSNSLVQAGWSSNPCMPTFPSFANKTSYNGSFGSGPVQIMQSSMAYNPKDQRVYFYTYVDTTVGGNNLFNTYVYSWPVGTCPANNTYPQTEYKLSYLLPCFDNNGNAWAVNYSGSAPYSLSLQEFVPSGSTFIPGDTNHIYYTAGAQPVNNAFGDIIFTPGGTMLIITDNKEYAINYNGYNGSTISNQVLATYVGKLTPPSGTNLVGLAYAGGSLIGSMFPNSAPGCGTANYGDVNILTGQSTPVTTNSGFYSTDNSDVVSGVGAAKSLVSVTPTGVSGEYTAVYNVFVQNFGNYPVSYIQAHDNLANIVHGNPANVKSVSIAFAGTPPPASYGINLNPAYNGTTNDSLLVSGGTLYNYPIANDDFTIQITVTLDNIQSGIIYYNTAVATGVGLGGDRLIDTSTNGSNPDLNLNDKPDDPGEDIPTPFLINVTPTSQPCTTLPTLIFQDNFGTGSSTLSKTLPTGVTSQYTGQTTKPLAINSYTLSNNANNADNSNYISLTDHTTGTGNMLIVNADLGQNVIYQRKQTGLCANLKYSLNAYAANIDDTTEIAFCNALGGYQPPNLTFQLFDSAANLVIANLSTGPIMSHTWTSYGMREPLPTQSTGTVYLQIINNGGGGCGNDFALDDVQFGLCDPLPTISVDGAHAGCKDSSTVLRVSLLDTSVFGTDILAFQWQDSIPGGSWTNTLPPGVQGSGNADTLAINPVEAANANQYYRVNVAAVGNLFTGCSYYSPAFLISLKASSKPPTSISANPGTVEGCSEVPITLTQQGGFLGDGGQYVWYTAGCGTGTPIGTGPSITVEPTTTTSYFVRAEGACNNTICAATAITVACALPTDLIYFHGSYANGIATLSWDVTDNQNLRTFYVERSIDGVNFSPIDSVNTAATDGEVSYSYDDNVASLHTQTISYRIVLVFKTGDQKSSSVVVVAKPLSLEEGLVVYPNPASSQLTISVNSDKEEQLSYVLINMQGQTLASGAQTLTRGANSISVNGLQYISSGAYILRIQTQDYVVQKKVIIQK
ncbi:MAG TPA: T9SS type A sorting domain-containing protein [Dinghuibacter sp.]|uniref:T9SS type A sorting domain-containing protein n=1 Tax=Dinghuibacter sp. TaxID=2024697 RepID=UPI002D17851C|nr:T9SS type A sorting domain-containing protein [Dinghuibacter sp.]HTJ13491.1 T9SS type A sorting domain-containing protein [Dinghuibacter sp.]